MEKTEEVIYLDQQGYEQYLTEIALFEKKLKRHRMSKSDAYFFSVGNDRKIEVFKLIASSVPKECEEYTNIKVNSLIGAFIYSKNMGDLTTYIVKGKEFKIILDEKVFLKKKVNWGKVIK